MFKTRLLSGIVLVVLALVLIITGGDLLLGSLLLISLIGMFELYRFFEIEKSIAAIVGYLAAVLFYGNLWTGFLSDSTALVMGTLILLMSVYVVTYPRFRTEQVMAVFLCVGDAFLYLPDQNVGERSIPRMADLSVFLGMRYLCLLCRCFVRKTQNVAEIKPEEIHRGCRWGDCRQYAADSFIYLCVSGTDAGADRGNGSAGADFRRGSADFYGRRPGSIRYKTQLREKRLRNLNSGARGNLRQI